MTNTHEINPPKSPLEFVLSRLSIQTGKLDLDGAGGQLEYTTADIAAMCASLDDPIARELVGVLNGEAPQVNRAVQELNLWGWNRWLIACPDRQIKPRLHGKLAAAVIADYQLGGKGYTMHEIRQYLGVSGSRIIQLTPHMDALMRRVREAEAAVSERVRREWAGLEH